MLPTHEGGVRIEPQRDVEGTPNAQELLKKIKFLLSEYVLEHVPMDGTKDNREDRFHALEEEIKRFRSNGGVTEVTAASTTELLRLWQNLLDWRRMLGGGVVNMVTHSEVNRQDQVSTERTMPEEDVTMLGGLLHDLAGRQAFLYEKAHTLVQSDGSALAGMRTEADVLTKEYRELCEVYVELRERYGGSLPEALQRGYEQVVAGDTKLRETLEGTEEQSVVKEPSAPQNPETPVPSIPLTDETVSPSAPLQTTPAERGGRTFRGLVRMVAGVREAVEAGGVNGVPGAELVTLREKVRAVEKEWGRARAEHLTEPEEDDALAKELFELKRDLGALEAAEFTKIKRTLEELNERVGRGVTVPPVELAQVHKEWWRMQMEPWWNASYNTTMSKLVMDTQSTMRRGVVEPKKTVADGGELRTGEEVPVTPPTPEGELPHPAAVEARSFVEELKDLTMRQERAMAAGGGVEAYARFAGEVARVRERLELLHRTPNYDETEFELCATICRNQNLLYENLREGVHEDPYWCAARAEHAGLKRELESAREAYREAVLAYHSEKPRGMLERLFVMGGGKEKEEGVRAARAAYGLVQERMRDLCQSWIEGGAQREGLTEAERILEAEYARRLGVYYLETLDGEAVSTRKEVEEIAAAAKREGGVERVARFGTAVRKWCGQRSVKTAAAAVLAGFLGMAPSKLGVDTPPTEPTVAEREEPAPLERESTSEPAVGAPSVEVVAPTASPEVASRLEQEESVQTATEVPRTEDSEAEELTNPEEQTGTVAPKQPGSPETGEPAQPTAMGERPTSPEAVHRPVLVLEGTYGPGDSIEGVLQRMLSDPASPLYRPELTTEEVGRIAHLTCEVLQRLHKKNSAHGIEENLGVREGDWDEVLAGAEYVFPKITEDILVRMGDYVHPKQ